MRIPRWGLYAVGLAAFYIAIRLSLLWRFPWFIDETITASFAERVSHVPADRFIALNDKKGLLTTWIGGTFVSLGNNPVTAVRLTSFGAGLAIAAAVGVVAGRAWGYRHGLLAAAVAIFLPYFVVLDSVGDHEPLVVALGMMALVLEISLAQRARLDVALLLGLVLGGGLLTKPTGLLPIILLPLSLLCFPWEAAERWRRLGVWAGCAAIALVMAFGISELQRLSPLFYEPGLKNYHTPGDFINEPGEIFSENWPGYRDALWGYLMPTGVILVGIGLIDGWRTHRRVTILLAGWSIAAAMGALMVGIQPYPRYLLYAVAPLCIFIAVGAIALFSTVWRRMPDGGLRVAAVSALALVCALPSLIFDARVIVDPATKRYPGLDDVQFVSSENAAGPAVRRIVDEIRADPRPGPIRVAQYGAYPHPYDLLLRDQQWAGSRFVHVFAPPMEVAAQTEYIVVDHGKLVPKVSIPANFRLVRAEQRPHGGVVIELYKRTD
jgi:4-amino-4-deoxy-L-arabinose transferase-like glycosyltransferase